MNLPDETREAAINRLKQLWGNNPGTYWDELRKAKLTTLEVFPELAPAQTTVSVVLGKSEQIKKSGR